MNPNFQVSNVRVRTSPRLDATGRPWNATIVTFMVGIHGPFILTFGPGQGTQAAITAAITAQVNQLIAQAQAINTLNQATAVQTPAS
jgi:hypothetical protein